MQLYLHKKELMHRFFGDVRYNRSKNVIKNQKRREININFKERAINVTFDREERTCVCVERQKKREKSSFDLEIFI